MQRTVLKVRWRITNIIYSLLTVDYADDNDHCHDDDDVRQQQNEKF